MTTNQKVLAAYTDVVEGRIRFQKQAAKKYEIDKRLLSYMSTIEKLLSSADFMNLKSRLISDEYITFSNKEKTKSLEAAVKLLRAGNNITEDVVEYTSVYVLKSDKFYKIGVASAISKRVGMLQTGNPFKLEVITQINFTNYKDAYNKEKELHRMFSDKHFHGEWFTLSDDDIKKVEAANEK